MKTKLTKLALATMSISLLYGCNDDSTAIADSHAQRPTNINVQAIDGYLRNAKIWLDVNKNYKLDPNEPFATTAKEGKAVLDLSKFSDDPALYPLVTQVIEGVSIDEDNPTIKVAKSYMMAAPKGYTRVTPVTTLVALKMADGKSEEQAIAEVQQVLSQPDLDPAIDYIAAEKELVASSAKALVQILPQQLGNSEQSTQLSELEAAAGLLGEEITEQLNNGQEPDLSKKTLVVDEKGQLKVADDGDGDGVADSIDAFPDDKTESRDLDGDGIGDNADTDKDGDGVENTKDAFPSDAKESSDLDLDGIGDNADTDKDGDGVNNDDDLFPSNPDESADFDLDGIGDRADTDDDGDGWLDLDEVRLGTDPLNNTKKPADLDGDFITDDEDPDKDGDGIANEDDPEPNVPADQSKAVKANDLEVVIYSMNGADAQAEKTLHVWNNETCGAYDADNITDFNDWGAGGVKPTGQDEIGTYWVLPLKSQKETDCVNFIVRTADGQSSDMKLEFATIKDRQGFVPADNSAILDNEDDVLPVELAGASAHWVDDSTLLWSKADGAAKVELYHSKTAGIIYDAVSQTITGGEVIALSGGAASESVKARFPHLSDWAAFTIDGDTDLKRDILKSQLIAVARDADNNIIQATKVQIPGVLDTLYTGGDEEDRNADKEKLGAVLEGSSVTFGVWAPTAQSVELLVYSESDDTKLKNTYVMTDDDGDGVYKLTPDGVAVGDYYRYRVKVYHPLSNKIELFETTDPYGQSFSTNSRFSQVVDMTDAALKPAGWDTYEFDQDAKPMDAVLYELHIRDFSVNDTADNRNPAYDGKYMAFTEESRDSVKHLKSMQEAGVSYVHLMPTFDIGTVNEDPAKRIDLNNTVAELCELNASAGLCKSADPSQTLKSLLEGYDPKSEDAQSLMNDIRDLDSFNWGYDPYHYNAPEGSTSTNAEGTTRIKEFREMVQALHDMGFKVVMDMVYNHTNASGLGEQSVLDKLVPGYYHRLNEITGAVERSTCCDNTATEQVMMEKVMIDSLDMWTKDYKIDSYRFDLAGFHMKSNLIKAREKVRESNKGTYFYMEGWDYGETVNNRRGVNGSQWNMGGTGYGTFSDRLRDAVRGTVYSDSGDTMRTRKGFGNAGVEFDYPSQQTELNRQTDLVRLGMAGNLKSYLLQDQNGITKRGQDFEYGGQHAGYAESPQETINYISKHDNQTLWDINQYKIDETASSDERVRMQNVANSTVVLSQGVPFFQLGVSLLRSKSMQRDSYNSGDWYNKVDFNLDNPELSNNWNVGLPRKDKDGANYPIIKEVIANSQTQPSREQILLADEQFKELLKIRTSSKLFHLDTTEQVSARVDFHNTGTDQIPGVIVMSIDDGTGLDDLDANLDAAVIVVNSTVGPKTMQVDGSEGFVLHDVQQQSADGVVKSASFAHGEFTVPALTTAVFVKKQDGAQGEGLPVSEKDTSNVPTYGSKELYLKGSMNGWGNVNAMAFANGVYTLEVVLDAGTQEFKIADADWSDGTNFGMGQITVAEGSLALTDAGGNIQLDAATKGVYRFVLDASDNAGQPTVAVTLLKAISDSSCSQLADSSEPAPLAETKLFVRGALSGWAADPMYQLTYKGDNVYQAYFTLDTAVQTQFKIADDTDNWGVQYSVNQDGSYIKLLDGMDYTAVKHDAGSSNNSIDLSAATYSVKLTLDGNDYDQGSLLFEKCDSEPAPYGETELLLRGDFNGWNSGTALTYLGDGMYQVSIYLQPGDYNFKLASEDWNTINLGFSDLVAGGDSVEWQDAGADNNLHLTVSELGDWTFVIDASDKDNPKLVVTKPKPQPLYACNNSDDAACDVRMYQIMVESFVDGDSSHDYGVGYGSSHHRGDLQGVIDSLDYIKGLNVNAIWLTPVFDSCVGASGDDRLDATGYFACDFFNVDPNFGSNEKLKELIDTAHSKGLYVFLDGVFGHVNKTGVKASPTGKLPTLKAGDANYPGQLVVYPDADSLAFFKEVATYWVREYGIDGWRLDQAYQVPLDAWRELRAAVESESAARQANGEEWGTLGYMVGEVWRSAEDIAKYAYGTDDNPALLSAFDFNRRYGIVQALAVEESGYSADATQLDAFWNSLANYPYHAMPNLMLGNHDLVRFGDLIERGNKGNYWQRHKAAISFLGAWSGPITLYYGDEIGDQVEGFAAKVSYEDNCVDQGLCEDHVARSSGKVLGVSVDSLSTEQADLKDWVTKLFDVRETHPALYSGKRTNLAMTSELYVDLKQTADEQIVYLLNVSEEGKHYALDANRLETANQLVDLMTGEVIANGGDTFSIDVPALTGRFLLVK
ncbi:pullulanase-type alpha-1,6-glucosidase [Photobacterium sp. SDRW27]|uniref:pullulanase-type alpha-1,6-glucosidase n=1 Tax=Photobacterium obscurum TaxID=2829490 RepID=UPI002244B490|nr:pullulanase-type alpha-1,6-glucosidase [Photobacterium obscurum]MCW8331260.1 pullulanase-type alpha-1,6-glucosidase [Photobacterium obscurum]